MLRVTDEKESEVKIIWFPFSCAVAVSQFDCCLEKACNSSLPVRLLPREGMLLPREGMQ